VRDRALVLVGFGGAFRRSELVALDVGDLTFDPARGVIVRVRRSKTDQLGEGADVAIPFGSQPEVCPVRALEAWRAASGVEEGALFRAIDRHGRVGGRLDGRDVARTLKELASQAGLASALCVGALAARGAGDHCRPRGAQRPRDHGAGSVEVADDGGSLRPHRRRLAGQRCHRTFVGTKISNPADLGS
jgi:integrase